jgi:hypothetical protein
MSTLFDNKIDQLSQSNMALEKALAEIQPLGGLLPTCSVCKKIRDDKGYWNQIEAYISKHSNASFTHGMCPAYIEDVYPEYADDLT